MAWSVGEVRTFSFTGVVQSEILDPGLYKLECWGAEGRTGYGSGIPGKGGYAKGIIQIDTATDIDIYVGEGGGKSRIGGWNGGGTSETVTAYGGGGGGASDIRIGGTGFENRVIVAGGGGGTGGNPNSGVGGHGGGLSGGDGPTYNYQTGGKGGTQVAGGDGVNPGVFGTAGTAGTRQGAGGGGYYGGGGAFGDHAGGGGGSSYYGTLSEPETLPGQRSGNGEVKITMLPSVGSSSKRRFAQII